MRLIFFTLFLMTAIRSFGGITEPLVKWPKNEVRVCFLDSLQSLKNASPQVKNGMANGFPVILFSSDEQRKIQTTIQQEFTYEKTGIYFTGWKPCSADPNSDSVIYKIDQRRIAFLSIAPSFAGKSSIGNDGQMSDKGFTGPSGKKSTVVFFGDLNLYVIVHEFGHLAGLRHENIHPAAAKDINCKYAPIKKETEDQIFSSTKVLTAYDSMSIMNMCNLNSNGRFSNDILSPDDQKALRVLYHN